MDVVLLGCTVVNLTAALWLAISAVAALYERPEERDPRPLVMPIFSGLAFAALAFSGLHSDETVGEMTALAWQLVHGGMLVGLHLFVRMYGGTRNG